MSNPPEFLIDGILPANEVHLLGGSSGSGKTTLIFQTLAAWQAGEPVFGHQSNPVPYSYVSLDRSRSSVTRTLQRLGLESSVTRILCQEDFQTTNNTVTEVINKAQSLHSDSQLFVIEGYQTIVGDASNKYSQVSSLLRRSATICSKKGVTILGIAHSPKMKTDESFQHSRELILGSVAWGAYSDTVITVQLEEATGYITVKILPRNAASESFNYVFGHKGVLVLIDPSRPKESIKLRLEALAPGNVITRSEVVGWARAFKVSDKTGDRALSECVKNKVLVQDDIGFYERTSNTPLKLVHESHLNEDN